MKMITRCHSILPCRFLLMVMSTAMHLIVTASVWSQERLIDHFPQAAQSGCMACHGEIEPIREVGSEMLDQIMQRGEAMGDPAGCVVCHNGDPKETRDKSIAHGGENFYPDPGSPWGERGDLRPVPQGTGRDSVAKSDDDRSREDTRNLLVIWCDYGL